MITAKELAEKLNGIAYGDSFDDVKQEAKESGLVIVYGASDDLMEFDGAIYDEGGCFDGGRVYFDRNGVDQEGEERANWIDAVWCDGMNRDGLPATWTYETEIPCERWIIALLWFVATDRRMLQRIAAEFIICRRNKRMVDVILAIIWIAILALYIVVGWKDAKSNNEVKKEITQMNELLLEQNSQLKEQNKHLNMVILSVCSKSVRDRKDQEEKREKATERDTPEKETPESSV